MNEQRQISSLYLYETLYIEEIRMFFSNNSEVEGQLGFLNLGVWWISSFSKDQRNYIEKVFQPFGHPEDSKPLTEGKIESSSITRISLLCSLSGWFSKTDDRHLAYQFLEKAICSIKPETDILDIHFLWGQVVAVNYKDRADPIRLKNAIEACKHQIAIAPQAALAFRAEHPNTSLPSHVGFKQLAIINEKSKNYVDAITICRDAKKQAWNGDWDKRILRCEKKLAAS